MLIHAVCSILGQSLASGTFDKLTHSIVLDNIWDLWLGLKEVRAYENVIKFVQRVILLYLMTFLDGLERVWIIFVTFIHLRFI